MIGANYLDYRGVKMDKDMDWLDMERFDRVSSSTKIPQDQVYFISYEYKPNKFDQGNTSPQFINYNQAKY